MMTLISLLLLASLLPHLTFTAHVKVGIVNGTVAKTNSRPYMVSIQLDGQHVCGGFLISDQWVLTAAHCWDGIHILTVLAGIQNLNLRTLLNHFTVKDYFQHEEYKSSPFRNDIMLLLLKEKVKLNNVKWIPLPKQGEEVDVNTLCSVAGWGRLQTNGQQSNHLMEVNMTTINHGECHLRWGDTYVVSQMICVHGSGGSCRGDSGGPLVCGDTAVGITSFGDICHCNLPEHPNVYTKISAYLPWIHQIIRNVK